jgi:hypothetical protein
LELILQSSEFDLDDGHHSVFVQDWLLPIGLDEFSCAKARSLWSHKPSLSSAAGA